MSIRVPWCAERRQNGPFPAKSRPIGGRDGANQPSTRHNVRSPLTLFVGGSAVVFEIGTKVIYPSHGVAEIVGREKKKINGEEITYLVPVSYTHLTLPTKRIV